jgi:hypothetical protein
MSRKKTVTLSTTGRQLIADVIMRAAEEQTLHLALQQTSIVPQILHSSVGLIYLVLSGHYHMSHFDTGFILLPGLH